MKSQPRKSTSANPDTPSKSLKTIPAKETPLSKSRQKFSELTAYIELLQKEIDEQTVLLEGLLQVYSQKIPGLLQARGSKQIELAKTLAKESEKFKFSKSQYRDIRTVIADLCMEAFSEIDPDEETISFYDRWADVSYKDRLAEDEALAKQLKDMVIHQLDPSYSAETDDIGLRKKNKPKNKQSEPVPGNNTTFPKDSTTAKQAEKERLKEIQEKLKLNSLRAIYILLAKTLHPDMVTDPVEKARNGELMKAVTTAYLNKDFATLLKLEKEWVVSESHNIQNLSADQLKVYIAALKKQVQELELELLMIRINPRYADIKPFTEYSKTRAVSMLRAFEKDLKAQIKAFSDTYRLISLEQTRSQFMIFITYYMDEILADDLEPDEFE